MLACMAHRALPQAHPPRLACDPQLLQRTTSGYLAALWRALEKVTEENFQYDKNWINECLVGCGGLGGGLTDWAVAATVSVWHSATALWPLCRRLMACMIMRPLGIWPAPPASPPPGT